MESLIIAHQHFVSMSARAFAFAATVVLFSTIVQFSDVPQHASECAHARISGERSRGVNGKEPLWSYSMEGAPIIACTHDAEMIVVGEGYWSTLHSPQFTIFRKDGTEVWNYTYDGTSTIIGLDISDDGGWLCVAFSYRLCLFNSSNREPVWNCSFTNEIKSVAMSGDGSTIVVALGYGDTRLLVFDRSSSEALWFFMPEGGSSSYFVDVALSYNGTYIAAANYGNNQLYMFRNDLSNYYLMWNTSIESTPKQVKMTDDGSMIALASGFGHIFSRDSPIYKYKVNAGGCGGCCAISEDGTRAAFGCWLSNYYTGKYHTYFIDTSDLDNVSEICNFSCDRAVESVALDGNGSHMLIGAHGENSVQKAVLFYNTNNLTEAWARYEDRRVVSTALSLDGKIGLAGVGDGSWEDCDLMFFETPNVQTISLSKPGVDPKDAYDDATYNYTVTYRDPSGASPMVAKVNIDGVSHDMIPSTGNLIIGKTYYYSTMLPSGAHNYSFEFANATQSARLPPSGAYSGPTVRTLVIYDENYTVDSLGHSPGVGDINTQFRFSARYKHNNATAAVQRNIILDGVSHEMTAQSGIPAEGQNFTFETKLPAGSHAYHFEFSDGKKVVRTPATGEFSGPTVYSSAQTPPTIVSVQYPSSATAGQTITVVAVVNDTDSTPTQHVYMQLSDGTKVDMSPSGNGSYSAQVAMTMQDLSFSIVAEDAVGLVGYSSGGLNMSEIVKYSSIVNAPPQLLDVKAERGKRYEHTFSARYTDNEGDMPYYCELSLDGSEIRMVFESGTDARLGITYIARMNLTKGIHTYKVKTTDGITHVESAAYEIEVTAKEVPSVPLSQVLAAVVLLACALACACVAVYAMYMRSNRYVIEQVFLLYYDGRLICHKTRGQVTIDEDILGSMLTAVQDFVRESFSATDGSLDELKYGKLRLVIDRGYKTILVVALSSGKASSKLKKRMRATLDDVNRNYYLAVDNWDGLESSFAGIGGMLDVLFEKAK